jgi:hypothetical protein
MSFNKRYIKRENLESAANEGLDYLINYITKPDALIIESDGISKQLCDIVGKTENKQEMKEKLKNIGFYEFK